MKLIDIFDRVVMKLEKESFFYKLSEIEKDKCRNFMLILETFSPSNAYPYELKQGNHYFFKDRDDREYFVSLIFHSDGEPESYFEFKVGYIDEHGERKYDVDKTETTDARRSDTICKIYKDECIPKFTASDQNLSRDLKFIAWNNDPRRFYYAMKIIKMFPIPDTELIEDKPHSITIRLKNFTPRKEPDAGDFFDKD